VRTSLNTERVGIGAREIGNGYSCYVVLEVGVNHGGHASGKTKCSIHKMSGCYKNAYPGI